MDDEDPVRVPVKEGDVLGGKYRVERILGAGGIGVVVSAWHLQLERRVALKFLLPDIMSNREAVARFSREARAVAKLRSEYVTQVLDVGELENGVPYIVMEYLEGSDLSRLLQLRGRLPVTDAVGYLLQACAAIAEAHAAGIVHRDLKPANLFLTRTSDGSPQVKVLDFGISKSTMAIESLAAVSLTSSTAVMGTPLYMSPEQMQSARGVDGRSDVWSLGAILYELLAGGPPFLAESLPQLCIAVMQQQPRRLDQLRADVSAELATVVATCLAKERSRRYASVQALALALAPFAPDDLRHLVRRISGTSAPPPPPPEESPDAASAHAPTLFDTSGSYPRAQPTTPSAGAERAAAVELPLHRTPPIVWVGLGATAVVVIAGLGFWLTRSPPPAVGIAATPPSSTTATPSSPPPMTANVLEVAPASAMPTPRTGPDPSGAAPAPSATEVTRRSGPVAKGNPPAPPSTAVGPKGTVSTATTTTSAPHDLMSDRE